MRKGHRHGQFWKHSLLRKWQKTRNHCARVGGAKLDFTEADRHRDTAEPKADDPYGYDTRQTVGGQVHAINLR